MEAAVYVRIDVSKARLDLALGASGELLNAANDASGIAALRVLSPAGSKRSCRNWQQRSWPRIKRHLPNGGFLRDHIFTNDAAGAGIR